MPPLPSPVPASSTPSPPPRPPSHQEWLEQAPAPGPDPSPARAPFAALLVRENQLVASAVNRMLEAGTPPVTRELEALREGSRQARWPGHRLRQRAPCPMCLSALVMNGIQAVYYALTTTMPPPFGFDSRAAYAAPVCPRARRPRPSSSWRAPSRPKPSTGPLPHA